MDGRKGSIIKPNSSAPSTPSVNSSPLSSSKKVSSTSQSLNGSPNENNTNGTTTNSGTMQKEKELTPEEYAKRNTRQIPSILLEDDVEKVEEEYPFDFERYYYESKEINRETVRELVVIPDETTTDYLQLVPKFNRTQVLPNDYEKGKNQYIDDCFDFYNSTQWKTLKTTNFNIDESPHSIVNSIMEKKIEYKALPDDKDANAAASPNNTNAVDVSIFQTRQVVVKTEEADEVHINYLERQLRTQPSKQDQANVKGLYSYFTLSEQPSPVIVEPSLYQPEKVRAILVNCKDLVFKFWDKEEETEPFYCSLYLYDISKKCRVSEVFHFDFNNEKTEKLLGQNQKQKNELNKTKKALFKVSKTSTDIYLVLKVDKILMGDLEDQSEPYIKLNIKDKEKDKLKEQIKNYCSRLGNYRQTFCWGCVPLFGDEGELGVGENTHFRPLYRYKLDSTDAQLMDSTMGEASKSTSTKKLKVIPGHCTVDISEIKNYQSFITENPFDQNTVVYNQSMIPVNFNHQLPVTACSSTTSSVPSTPNLVSPRPQEIGNITLPPPPALPEKIVKEIQEFTLYPKVECNQEFVHNLYIYPETVNLSNFKNGSITARNITCKVQLMECDDNVNFDGLKLIYGKSNSDTLISKYYTSINYHSKTPVFNDEIKIQLPINLTSNHHLLVSFYHITCQSQKGGDNSFDQPIGHALLPIYNNGKIISDDTYNLPVAYELPPRYMKPDMLEALRYVDNKKPVFQIRTKLVSSISTFDEPLNTFFNTIASISNVARPSASEIGQLGKAIKGLTHSKPESIVQFFVIIANQLFRIMTSPSYSHELAMISFVVIGELLSIVNDISNLVYERYAKYVFENNYNGGVFGDKSPSGTPNSSSPTSTPPLQPASSPSASPATSTTTTSTSSHSNMPVYEIVIKTWLELMRFQEHNSDNILRFSKFFFTIILKSMTLSLIERSKREENKTRKGRFVGIRNQLRKLISILVWESSTRVKHTFKLSKELVKGLATLISGLLSIADRGYVFSIIDKLVSDFDSTSSESETEINELKFEFLRIVCQNDYFVQLNLPMPYRIDPTLKLTTVLTISKHFFSELLNLHISNGLAHKECLVRMDAANSLRDTLIKIEMDTRWKDPLTKQRIVGVFVPYLSSIVSNWNMIKDDSFIVKRNILISFLYLLKNVHPNLIRLWWKEENRTKYLSLLDILITCTDIFEFVGKDKLLERALESASIRTSTAKSILEDFYTNTNRTAPYGAKKYNRSLREKRVDARKSILETYNTGRTSELGSSGQGISNGTTNSSLINSGTGSVKDSPSNSLYNKSAAFNGYGVDKQRYNKGTLSPANKINLSDYDDRLESNLANEVGSVILDICDDFMYEFERELKTSTYFDVLQKVFKLLQSLLTKNQPISLVPKLYFVMRQFVFKFPKTIFEQQTSFCGDFCNGVIRHCYSPNKTTREEASAFTYILMRKNYEQTRKNFVRVKTQIILGLSKLVDEIKDDYYLSKSLDTINAYANSQAEKLGTKTFAKQVEELTKRIHTFVIDNIKINNHQGDPEMVADLCHRIADNNKSNADTRLIWLQRLANFHKKQENYSEAAQCYLHMAALVAEYLTLVGSSVPTIIGSSSFLGVNKNSLEESNSYIEREEDESGNPKFTIDSFVSLINDSILLLKDAELYEMANLVYKLLIPVHEYNLNYEELAKAHGDLQDIFKKILECTRTKSRMLGSYYRVGFYGKKFEEMNGLEFVYKEPKITRLVEIKDRLRSLFAKKFGVDEQTIQIIETSNTVDVSKLDIEQQSYLQITSVQPYFEQENVPEPTAKESTKHGHTHHVATPRRTVYDKCVNLSKFMFETPYTLGGQGHGNNVGEQCKRKTILTVQHHFPYTKKRILVLSKQEINLSPIENSIESIESRTETLLNEIKTVPPNLKTLQIVISGTLRLQVNSGPQEICRTFLSNTSSNASPQQQTYSPELVNKLKQALSIFLGTCGEALQFNRSLIDQTLSPAVEFQDEMEQGYIELSKLLESYQVFAPEGSYQPLSLTLANSAANSASVNVESTNSSNSDDSSLSSPSSSVTNSGTSLLVPNRKSLGQRLSNSFKKGLSDGAQEN